MVNESQKWQQRKNYAKTNNVDKNSQVDKK